MTETKMEKGDLVQCNALKTRPTGTVVQTNSDGTIIARVTEQDRAKCRFETLEYYPECFTLLAKAPSMGPREYKVESFREVSPGSRDGQAIVQVRGPFLLDGEMSKDGFRLVALREGEIVVKADKVGKFMEMIVERNSKAHNNNFSAGLTAEPYYVPTPNWFGTIIATEAEKGKLV